MDEILIEEKRYVSSKRAAKLTGYAKDYVGQLCREGRVPARLVGRSWYVLESAIQDHRFGNDVSPEESAVAESVLNTEKDMWVSPRYESTTIEELPTIQQPEKTEEVVEEVPDRSPEALQDSWRAWFDRDREVTAQEETPLVEENIAPQEEELPQPEPVAASISIGEENESVTVPIHTIYDLPPEDLLPRYSPAPAVVDSPRVEEEEAVKPVKGPRISSFILVGKALLLLVAVFSVAAAVIGTGALDEYTGVISKASIISGVEIYTR